MLTACGLRNSAPNSEVPTTVSASEFVASAKGHIDVEGGVIRLAAQREGVIERVLVEEGDSVTRGQVLAILVDEQAKRGVALAEAELRQAKAAMRPLDLRIVVAEREALRLAPLATDDTVARREYDQAADQVELYRAERFIAEAAMATAMQRVAVAKYEVEQRVVRAPMDGKIVRRQARPGDGVSIATVTPLFLFAPDAPRIVRAELEERFITKVKAGHAAELALEADESRRYSARVLRLGYVVGNRAPNDDPTQRQDNRVVECVLAVDAPDLLIGQRVIVRIRPAVSVADGE